jgi:hypothetical protein
MKKAKQSNPLKTFNDNHDKRVKSFDKTLKKFQGEIEGSQVVAPRDSVVQKPISANFGVGPFNVGTTGKISKEGYKPTEFSAGVNTKRGLSGKATYDVASKDYGINLSKSVPLQNDKKFSIDAGYKKNAKEDFDYNKIKAGLNLDTHVGKNKLPVKLGVTYNQKKGGQTKSKKK